MNDLGMGITVSLKDAFSNNASKIESSMVSLDSCSQVASKNISAHMEKIKKGGIAMGAGIALMSAPGAMIHSTIETQKALAEISSLGIEDLESLSNAAQNFSDQWSGSSKAQFITASYDIKSALSDLSDEAVGAFTASAALTAKATKATVNEMTSAFATGYGIFKPMMDDLDDIEFGKSFSGAMAKTVQSFKTNGIEMAAAIKNIGATATASKIPLQEQLAILGQLQTTMPGSEAGTAYKAFITKAASAGEKLGLELVGVDGKVKSLLPILEELKTRFPDLSQAAAQTELKEAFGSDEAVKFLLQMVPVTDSLKGKINDIGLAMKNGTMLTEEMASAMNQDIGARLSVLRQRIGNLADTLGTTLLPIITPIINGFSNAVLCLQKFTSTFPGLTKVLLITISTLGAVLFVGGGIVSTLGLIGIALPAIKAGILAVGAASASTGSIMALAFSPATLIIGAISLAILGIVWAWGKISPVFKALSSLLGTLKNDVGTMPVELKNNLEKSGLLNFTIKVFKSIVSIKNTIDGIKVAISRAIGAMGNIPKKLLQGINKISSGLAKPFISIVNSIKEPFNKLGSFFFNSGKMILITFAKGIKSSINLPFEAIKDTIEKIRNLLPFSDAKIGPLSNLTKSGESLLKTFAFGIKANHLAPIEAVVDSLRETETQIVNIPKKITTTISQVHSFAQQPIQATNKLNNIFKNISPSVDQEKINIQVKNASPIFLETPTNTTSLANINLESPKENFIQNKEKPDNTVLSHEKTKEEHLVETQKLVPIHYYNKNISQNKPDTNSSILGIEKLLSEIKALTNRPISLSVNLDGHQITKVVFDNIKKQHILNYGTL